MSAPTFGSMLSRRQMLRGFAAVAASSVLSGCGASLYRTASSSSATTQPSQPASGAPGTTAQPLPIGAITAASMTIGAATEGSFGPGFVGLAYEKQAMCTPLFSAVNNDLVSLFKRLGAGVLRVGGSSVDENVWTLDGKGQTAGQIAPWDVNALAAFLRATGWTCIYGVNLGGSAMGATTPALAAAEVAYVAQQLGSSLVGVEIGNECESYGDPGSYYPGGWTVEMFESLWKQYREAIVAVTPSAPITGPAAGSDVDGWTIPFGEYVTRSEIGLLTQHYYRGTSAGSTATVEDLVSPDNALGSELLQLKYGAQSIDVPFRIAGCNSYSGGGVAGVSNAYASSLWAIDMIFNCALGGAAGVNFQGGDQAAYTSIEDSAGSVVGPRPIFYGLLMAAMANQGTLLSTQLSAGGLNVTGYAVEASDGSMSLVIVNKDATENLDLSIALPESVASATLQMLTQRFAGATTPNLAALSGVTIQGATVGIDGSFNPGEAYGLTLRGMQLSCYVPALSAVLIQLT
jgi:hypothetical protein